MSSNPNDFNKEADAQTLSVDVLTWIAADGEMMSRFLAISGLSIDNLREASSEPGFLAGVVGFLMSHEPTLFAYCNDRDINPQAVKDAWRALGGDTPFDGSI